MLQIIVWKPNILSTLGDIFTIWVLAPVNQIGSSDKFDDLKVKSL